MSIVIAVVSSLLATPSFGGGSGKKWEPVTVAVTPFLASSGPGFSITPKSETTKQYDATHVDNPTTKHLEEVSYSLSSMAQAGVKLSAFGLSYSFESSADQRKDLRGDCGDSFFQNGVSYYGRPISLDVSFQDFRRKPDIICHPEKALLSDVVNASEAQRYVDSQDIRIKAMSANMLITVWHMEGGDDLAPFEGGQIPIKGGASLLLKTGFNEWRMSNVNNLPFVPPTEADYYGADSDISKVYLKQYMLGFGGSLAGRFNPFTFNKKDTNWYSGIAMIIGTQYQGQEIWRSDYAGNPVSDGANKRKSSAGSVQQVNVCLGYFYSPLNVGLNIGSDSFEAEMSSYKISTSRARFEFYLGLAF